MEKHRDLRNGRSNQQTGGDNGGFLDKSLKKEKVRRLSCVGEQMNQLSHSTTTSIKRVNFSQKFSDHYGFINHASPPRKLRSAMKKRPHEPQKISAPVFADSRNENGGYELQPKDCNKQHKTTTDEYKNSNESRVITKDEEEAAAALFALAQTLTNKDLIETKEVKPDTDWNKSHNKCLLHVHICNFIKVSKSTASQELVIVNKSNQETCVNVIPDTNPQKITNEDNLTGLHLQSQYSVSFDDHLTPQELPYFNTMDQDHSKWSKQQQYSGTQFASTSCYHNWKNQTDTIAPLFGSSKHGLNTEQQCTSMSVLATRKGKMLFSEHDDKGSLFLVDNGPTLKLSL